MKPSPIISILPDMLPMKNYKCIYKLYGFKPNACQFISTQCWNEQFRLQRFIYATCTTYNGSDKAGTSRLNSSVGSTVYNKTLSLSKPFITYITFEGLLTRVGACVHYELSTLPETFTAKLTFIWLISSMDACVTNKMST